VSAAGVAALLFDFDGLLVDSETAGLRSWQELYEEHGCELDLGFWLAEVAAGRGPCMPKDQLEAAVGERLDWEVLEARLQVRRDELLVVRPGAAEVLAEARQLGLTSAIVSNAPDWWLDRQLARTGLGRHWFSVILSKDPLRQSKPAPDVYVAALDALRLDASRAVAFEDSPAGIAAANAAGIACVAVPNEVTVHLPLPATMIIPALGCEPLADVLDRVIRAHQRLSTQ